MQSPPIHKRLWIVLIFCSFISGFSSAQVGIGTVNPSEGVLLDVNSPDKGILIPKIALTATTTQAPITTTGTLPQGVLIFNTATAGTGSTAVSTGFYYWNGTDEWIPVGLTDTDWTVDGDNIYNANTDFVGVGEIAPDHKLHVTNNEDGAGVIKIQNDTSGGFAGMYFYQGAAYKGHIGYVNTGGSLAFGGPGLFQVAAGNRDLIFSADDTSENYVERVRITKEGPVGVNVNAPSHQIHIADSISSNVMRLEGPGLNGAEARISFGDGNFAYIEEDVDDALTIRATAGTRVLGDLNVTGTLSKGGGTFKIDHPLDPKNKYLYHSFVESPDMMNIYNGNITTNASGQATVTMPNYFDALNKKFRYQLTVIGSFEQAMISKEMEGNTFQIKTTAPNVKVSWMVTGIRKDPWANENRVIPEVEKTTNKGTYLHPYLYDANQPKTKNTKK